MFLDVDQHLVVYIWGKRGVEENKVVNAIELDFILLGRRNKLVISASTSFAKIVLVEIVFTFLLGLKIVAEKIINVKFVRNSHIGLVKLLTR